MQRIEELIAKKIEAKLDSVLDSILEKAIEGALARLGVGVEVEAPKRTRKAKAEPAPTEPKAKGKTKAEPAPTEPAPKAEVTAPTTEDTLLARLEHVASRLGEKNSPMLLRRARNYSTRHKSAWGFGGSRCLGRENARRGDHSRP